MIRQTMDVCNVSPSALVFSRVCKCTIMFTQGPEPPHNSICNDCTSAKKVLQNLETTSSPEASFQKIGTEKTHHQTGSFPIGWVRQY
jgi:hypothetical protein